MVFDYCKNQQLSFVKDIFNQVVETYKRHMKFNLFFKAKLDKLKIAVFETTTINSQAILMANVEECDFRVTMTINKNDSRKYIAFVIAHELAHNLLGHTGLDGSCQFRCPNSDICGEYSNCIEWQADSLAFNLLCPDFDE